MMGIKKGLADYHMGELVTLCYMVERGKPIALVPLKVHYLKEAKEVIKEYNLKTYIRESTGEWIELWIYKEEFMRDVIENLPEKPKTIYEHWILGKAFGYSDQAIKEFLQNGTICS